MFDNDPNSIYEIVDLSSATTPGLKRMVANKTEYKPGYDDLENNIAWNRFLEQGVETVEFEVVSSSNKFEILKNSSVTFTVKPKFDMLIHGSLGTLIRTYYFDNLKKYLWDIDLVDVEQDWCEVVRKTNESITIRNIKGYNKNPVVISFKPIGEGYQEIRQEVRVKNY